MTRITIADAAAELLSEHRALSSEEIGRSLAERGSTRAANPTQAASRALGADDRFSRLTDGRWAMPSHLADGATLSHRLLPQEVENGMLAVDPDLALLSAFARVGLSADNGERIEFVFDEDARETLGIDCAAVLVLPDDWLEQPAGALVDVRVAGGRLSMAAGTEPQAAARMVVRRMAEAARSRLESMTWVYPPPTAELDFVLLDMLADDPALLADPVPPLGDALRAAGLEVHRGHVGLPGTDWETVDEFFALEDDDLDDDVAWDDDDFGDDDAWEAEDEATDPFSAALAGRLDLDEEDVERVQVVAAALDLHHAGRLDDTRTLHGLADVLAWPGVAILTALQASVDPDVEPFAAAIAAAARGQDAAGPEFVLGACAEARDDTDTAERHLLASYDADPEFGPAAVGLSRWAEDRGDYATALGLLRSAGVPPSDAQRRWLESIVRPISDKIGRNEPCPCGSGRKYKACHLGRPGIPRIDPASALLHKVERWLQRPGTGDLADEVIDEADPDPSLDHDEIHEVPLIDDILLFDRGELERYLEIRGQLLPEAELALGRTWLETRRSLYEVQGVRPGSGVTLRDMFTDAVVELPDRSISTSSQPLDVVCVRLLPDGAGSLIALGGFTVPRMRRDQATELVRSGDGPALLHWLLTPAAPLRLRNMDGEPILLVTLEYRVKDPSETARALERKLSAESPGRYIENVKRKGETWIRGSISLDGDLATIEANSAKRAARLERTLLSAAPGATLLRRDEQTVADATAGARAEGTLPEPLDPATDPAVAAAMEEFIRGYEERWINEPVPALGGLTPRKAAADPKARPGLEALLDDMAWQQRQSGGHGLMDAARLRRLLALPERPT